jgi:hypothetical protein
MLKKEGKEKEEKKKEKKKEKKEKRMHWATVLRHMWRDTVAKWILHLALDKLMDAPFSLLLSHFG